MATSSPFGSHSKPSTLSTEEFGLLHRFPKPLRPVWPLVVVTVAVMAMAAGCDRSGGSAMSVLTAPVKKGDLLVTVTEDGNVESAVNIDIKCGVAGGTSILWIVEDGKEVKKGEKLVELDASALEEQINQQKITFEKARAAKIQAEKDWEASKIAVNEYLEGTFVKELQDADAQITIALENLRSSENALEHSERMYRKGYISSLDLESQKFSVQRAQLELDSARTSKDVLTKYTKEKMMQELESTRDSAEAQMRSEDASFALEESRLKRLEAQMKECLIMAPASGMVVYANQQQGRMGGSQQPQIEEGAAVRERQTILRLPDLAQMQVKVNVHESKIEALGDAMRRAQSEGRLVPARVRIQDRSFVGSLSSIANQPEPTSWFSGNIKEYATIIAIDGTAEGLRPGMTAECNVLVNELKDILFMPVAAVVEQRGEYLCWVQNGDKIEKRPLVLGDTNDQFVEIKDGVAEGENVILNPRTVVEEARGIREEVEKTDDTKFGDRSGGGKNKGGKRGPAGKGGPGGPPAEAGPPGASGPGGSDAGKQGAGGAPTGGRPGGGSGRSMDLTRFDKDKDGKISKDEAPSQMVSFFDQMDTDGDGFIDKAEIDALRKRFGGGGGGPPQ